MTKVPLEITKIIFFNGRTRPQLKMERIQDFPTEIYFVLMTSLSVKKTNKIITREKGS